MVISQLRELWNINLLTLLSMISMCIQRPSDLASTPTFNFDPLKKELSYHYSRLKSFCHNGMFVVTTRWLYILRVKSRRSPRQIIERFLFGLWTNRHPSCASDHMIQMSNRGWKVSLEGGNSPFPNLPCELLLPLLVGWELSSSCLLGKQWQEVVTSL